MNEPPASTGGMLVPLVPRLEVSNKSACLSSSTSLPGPMLLIIRHVSFVLTLSGAVDSFPGGKDDCITAGIV